jgi:mannose/cellobiose epimerase-like protein (N-acyl-D-glucosamine 2-epimerase family)
MMEFLRGLMEGEDGGRASILSEAFHKGEEAAREYGKRLIELADQYNDAGHSQAATVLFFVGVLRAVGIAKQAVYNSVEKHGETGNPVKQTWDILEEVLTSRNVDEAIAKVLKRQEDGK